MPSALARSTVVRDPVHGDLRFSAEEVGLLDTSAMQRLRGVRQLGTAHLVFPGAQHTRFEHSLGTAHLVDRLIDAIERGRGRNPRDLVGVSEEERRILRAAALVHDVTHIPFGHNIEDQTGLLERHDTPERFRALLGPGSELGTRLSSMGIQDEVLAVLCPDGTPGLPSVPHHWRELLSDTVCADILDYLARDAYYTGLNLLYDERILDYFGVDRASGHLFVDVAKRGLLREDIVSELLRVLEARYFFAERVYYHHAKIAAGAMLAACVERALLTGAVTVDVLQTQTDESLVVQLEQDLAADGDADSTRALDLLRRFRSRRLLKRACVYPRYANRDVQDDLVARFFSPGQREERRAIERALEDALRDDGFDAPVLLYCPARKMQLKAAATHVRAPGQDAVVPLSQLGAIPRLDDLSASYRDLWKMVILVGEESPRAQQRVAEVAATLLPEATNVYRPPTREVS